ncbi:MAG: GntR family transcriptional regulator [Pseudomonadota bacterium]
MADEDERERARPKSRGSSGHNAYDALFDLMLSGKLKPGDRVREAEIATMLGTSRTPVREAMRQLETQGLLTHEPRKGVTIRSLDHSAITELYLFRETLEGMAAAEAARHASRAEVETLEDLVAGPVATGLEPVRLSRQNKTFHRTIYRAAHNRFLLQSLEGLDATMTLLGRTTLSLADRPGPALSEHREIVAAIAAGDSAAAEEAAKRHIRAAHRARLRLLTEDETSNEPGPPAG